MDEKYLSNFAAKNEWDGCLLCYDAPCTKNCINGLDPAKVIRSLRFENFSGAASASGGFCAACKEHSCSAACVKGVVDRPVRIPELMEYAGKLRKSGAAGKADLNITFCGVPCENPFFLSSSVVASNYEMVARAFEMGWAGAAFKTIGTFVPEEVSPRFTTLSKEGNSFIGFKNIEQISDHTPEENFSFLSRLKRDYPQKVIIASIMGRNEDEWTQLAHRAEQAGADIIECNFSCPHMSGAGLGSDVGQDPELVSRYTAAAVRGSSLPILAKMTPNTGNMEIAAKAAMAAGAAGIAAINTIKSILNVDLDGGFGSEPQVKGKSCVGGYSGKSVKPIALRFIHDIKKHSGLQETPVSGMGGIETWRDAAEFISMGCDNLQVTTAVMQYGYRIIDDLIGGLADYLAEKGFGSVEELVGKALPQLVPAEELDRSSVSYPKIDKGSCIGCGRCYISCRDGGHDALKRTEDGKPVLIPKQCVGCHLCLMVCPVGVISPGKRVPLKKE